MLTSELSLIRNLLVSVSFNIRFTALTHIIYVELYGDREASVCNTSTHIMYIHINYLTLFNIYDMTMHTYNMHIYRILLIKEMSPSPSLHRLPIAQLLGRVVGVIYRPRLPIFALLEMHPP